MERREELLQKALTLFLRRGYDNTPMSHLAEDMRMSKAGLYHYFGSKEELLFLIHKDYLEKHFLPIIEEAEKVIDPQKRLILFLRNYTKLLARSSAARVLIHEMARLKPKHREEIRSVWKRAYQLIRSSISELKKSGKAKDINSTFASFLAIGMCCWTYYWFDYNRQESADDLAESVIKIFTKGLLTNKS